MLIRPYLLAALAVATALPAQAQEKLTLHAPKDCLVCVDYADYLRQEGFTVDIQNHDDMAPLKKRLRVPKDVEARPTGVIGPYFIEGHVPAEDIRELLKEAPKARGLAVPGQPMGAPGVEYTAPTCDTACTIVDNDQGSRRIRREIFLTLLVKNNGDTSTYARH